MLRITVTVSYFIISVALFCSVPVPQDITVPRNPSEAYERATEPLRDWSKSNNQTLETNIAANKEQERRAREYLKLFRIGDWNAKQLFDLGQLYFVALMPAETERAFAAYLRDPAATEVTRARTDLLWALASQRKWDEAIPIAEQLLNDSSYDWNINNYLQFVIEGLRTENISRAITLSEKRLPRLLQFAESQANSPGLVITILDKALELGSLYREAGKGDSAKVFSSTFLSRFQKSPLASNGKIKHGVEAALLRLNLTGSQAPAIEGSEFIDLPMFKLADLKGKVILLDFLAHWCGPCIVNFPALDALQKKYESKGLVIIGITQYYGFFGDHEKTSEPEELAALKALKTERRAKLGFVVGPQSNFMAYGISGLPAYVLIDRTGKVRVIKTSEAVGEGLERIIQSLIAEP